MTQTPPPPPPPYQPPYYEDAAATYAVPSAGLATGSLVLGLISLPTNCICVGPLLGLIAVVLGIVALVRSGNAPQLYGGQGMAIGGVVTGGISVLIAVVLWISLAALGTSFGRVVREGLSVADVAVDLANVGDAAQRYHAVHDEYPPDLETLVAADLIGDNPVPLADDDTIGGMSYVTGLSPDDPTDWILAYKETEIIGIKLVGVLYNPAGSDAGGSGAGESAGNDAPADDSGVSVSVDSAQVTVAGNDLVEVLEADEFASEWARFKRDYEEARGRPPEVIEGQE